MKRGRERRERKRMKRENKEDEVAAKWGTEE